MLGTIRQIPSVLGRHTPTWFWTLLGMVLAGTGVVAYYPEIRARCNPWVAEHLMPESLSYWHVIWVLVIWVMGSLVWNEAKRRQNAARLVFGPPRVWKTALGPDALHVVPEIDIHVASIVVKNSPINTEDGRDVEDAHAHAIFRSQGGDPLQVSNLRWTEAPKPRADEVPPGHVPKFQHAHQFIRIPANDSWRQIDFAVSGDDPDHFFAFAGRAQKQGWMAPDLKLPNGRYEVDIEVRHRGETAKTKVYLERLSASEFNVWSAELQEALDLGAAVSVRG